MNLNLVAAHIWFASGTLARILTGEILWVCVVIGCYFMAVGFMEHFSKG